MLGTSFVLLVLPEEKMLYRYPYPVRIQMLGFQDPEAE